MRDLSNVSSLISSFSRSSGTSGLFNLADYASIKNGSYGKLMKAYYGKSKASKTDPTNKTDKTDKTDKNGTDKLTSKKAASSILGASTVDTATNKALSKIKTESDGLASAAGTLYSDKTWKDAGKKVTEDVVKAAEKFVSEYNDVIAQAGKVSTTQVTTKISSLKNMTNVMTNALKNVGITVAKDGKLALDKDALQGANIKDVKSLMAGDGSYVAQVGDMAVSISSSAIMSSGFYNENGSINSNLTGLFNTKV